MPKGLIYEYCPMWTRDWRMGNLAEVGAAHPVRSSDGERKTIRICDVLFSAQRNFAEGVLRTLQYSK